MRNRAPIAAWAALLVSLTTLILVASIALQPPANDVDRLEARIDDVLAILEGESTFGTVVNGGLVGDVSGLDSQMSELASAVAELRAEVGIASSSSESAASVAEDALSEIETISARLSDICFRLDAC